MKSKKSPDGAGMDGTEDSAEPDQDSRTMPDQPGLYGDDPNDCGMPGVSVRGDGRELAVVEAGADVLKVRVA